MNRRQVGGVLPSDVDADADVDGWRMTQPSMQAMHNVIGVHEDGLSVSPTPDVMQRQLLHTQALGGLP